MGARIERVSISRDVYDLRKQRNRFGKVAVAVGKTWVPGPTITAPDVFTIAGPADTSHTLTYVPRGVNVVMLNGLGMAHGTDYTLDWDTGAMTVLAPLLAGDVIEAHYVTTGHDIAEAGPTVIVDWSEPDWLYKSILASDATDYSAAAYGDSAWSTLQTPAGGANFDSSFAFNSNNFVQDERIWLRRHLGTVPTGAITVNIRVNNYIGVWWNGTTLIDDATTDYYATVTGSPLSLAVPTAAIGGDNVLAIRATDNPGGTPYLDTNPATQEIWYIDAQVEVTP